MSPKYSKFLRGISLDGKVALVTGSSRGIGSSIAVKVAEADATVVIDYKRPESCTGAIRVHNIIKKMGNDVHIIKADVSKEREVKHTIMLSKNYFTLY